MASKMFEATAPDGTTVRFLAPANSTPDQLQHYAFIEYQEARKSRAKSPEAAPASEATPSPVAEAPMEPSLPPEAPQESPEQFEQRLQALQQEQEIRQGQMVGGALGAGLSLGKLGADVGGMAMRGIGSNIAQGMGIRPEGGTGGEKWARNWAGQERPGIGGVPEASAAYQRSKGQGKVSGRMTKMWGPRGPNEPPALIDRLMARSATPTGLDQAKMMFKSLMGPVSVGARYALPPLALAAAAGEGIRGKQMYEEGDTTGATLAGLSALGAVGSLTPLAPIAAPVGMGAGAMQYLRSQLAPNTPVTPEEEAAASRAAFGIYPRAGRRVVQTP